MNKLQIYISKRSTAPTAANTMTQNIKQWQLYIVRYNWDVSIVSIVVFLMFDVWKISREKQKKNSFHFAHEENGEYTEYWKSRAITHLNVNECIFLVNQFSVSVRLVFGRILVGWLYCLLKSKRNTLWVPSCQIHSLLGLHSMQNAKFLIKKKKN